MRPPLFVDSGAWLALSDASDQYHAAAKRAYPTLLAGHRLISTNLVVSESYTLLRQRVGLAAAFAFLDALRQSGRIEVVYSDPELEAEAVAILHKYRDQMFSYADAVSFACMKARDITLAFSFDVDFATVGFERLPRKL